MMFCDSFAEFWTNRSQFLIYFSWMYHLWSLLFLFYYYYYFKFSIFFFKCLKETIFRDVEKGLKIQIKNKNSWYRGEGGTFKSNISGHGKNLKKTQLLRWDVANVKFMEKLLENERKLLKLHFFALRRQFLPPFVNFIGMVYVITALTWKYEYF